MINFFRRQKRYGFLKVFWMVLGIYFLFGIFGIIVLYMSPTMNTAANWKSLVSWHALNSQLFSALFFSIFYYVMINIFYVLFASRKKGYLFLKPLPLSFAMVAVYYIGNMFFFNPGSFHLSENNKVMENKITTGLVVFSYTTTAVVSIGISLLVAYLLYLLDERKQRKVLEEQKMVLEVEKSQANFNFLKSQINPHFLHNTLNFLYAKSLPYSPELSEGILTLSDIMRYALSPGATKDGKVLLKDEIEHVQNVIKINQLRFSNNLHVNFDVNGTIDGATVIPFILITLVENAFKHGDLKTEQFPITIRLGIINKVLHFYCHNKKATGAKELSTGIGLDNIRKQLDLTYGYNYSLKVKDEPDFYTTELTIQTI